MSESLHIANAVIADSEQRLLVVHRSLPTLDQWEFPGDVIQADEAAEVVAERAVREHLNARTGQLEFLGGTEYVQSGKSVSYSWYGGSLLRGEKPKIRGREPYNRFMYINLGRLGIRTHYRFSRDVEAFTALLRDGAIRL